MGCVHRASGRVEGEEAREELQPVLRAPTAVRGRPGEGTDRWVGPIVEVRVIASTEADA